MRRAGPGRRLHAGGRREDKAQFGGILNTLYEMHLRILTVQVLTDEEDKRAGVSEEAAKLMAEKGAVFGPNLAVYEQLKPSTPESSWQS